jgi:hypothetical protein
MRRPFVVAFLLAFSACGAAAQGLEYRLEKERGRAFALPDGKDKLFHELPFMTGKDFAGASVVAAKNPNVPGTYNVEVRHSVIGRAKFQAVADADRERTYCVIVRDVVRGCSAFAPPVKDTYNGSIVFGLSKAEAETLARGINAAVK